MAFAKLISTMEELPKDSIPPKEDPHKDALPSKEDGVFEEQVEKKKHLTSYFESLIHLFKAGLGPGCFAMAEAMSNCGIAFGTCLTIFLSISEFHLSSLRNVLIEFLQQFAFTSSMCY